MSERDDDEERVRAMVKRAMKGKRPEPDADAAEGEAREPDDDDLADAAAREAEDREAEVALDEVDLKDALRGALRPPPGAVAPSLLSGVQKKLRVRSRGKFYGDGWSTSSSPRSTYLVTSALMLVLVVIVFFALLPWSSTKLP